MHSERFHEESADRRERVQPHPHLVLYHSVEPQRGWGALLLLVGPTCSALAGPVPSNYTLHQEAPHLPIPTSHWPVATTAEPGRRQWSPKWPTSFLLFSSSNVNQIMLLFCLKTSRIPTAQVGGNPLSFRRAQGPSLVSASLFSSRPLLFLHFTSVPLHVLGFLKMADSPEWSGAKSKVTSLESFHGSLYKVGLPQPAQETVWWYGSNHHV